MNNKPARLHKIDDEPVINKITRELEKAILRHPTLFLGLGMTILILLFFAIIFTVTGASAVESGNIYNHLKDVI